MRHIHNQEKEQFKKLFLQEQIDNFEDRFKILEFFLQTEGHVTAGELTNLLNEKGQPLDLDFVRDTLNLMSRFGFAKKNRFGNGQVRYEHRHIGQHHDHMICIKCRNIIEFKDETLENIQRNIAVSHGFYMLQHKMEIYGICKNCFQQRSSCMPLASAKQGECVVIKEFSGGKSARLRLMTMGLRIGDQIEVITNNNMGQMVIAADFRRYIIGRGLAQKIFVETKSNQPEP